MRASIIIASYNEGEALCHTVDSCVNSSAGLEYQIVIADDASTDSSANDALARFPEIRLVRHGERQGISPARVSGARAACGDVLIFLDAHTKPEFGSLKRLVEDVEEADGEVIVTPAIATLDVQTWISDVSRLGNGYGMQLETLERCWLALNEMQATTIGQRHVFETPAAIGAAMAISRTLYVKLLGFDADMKYWGVEDLDISLKCWLMGYRVVHDPIAIVGHRFQSTFNNYDVPIEHVVVNHLRMARKNFTDAVWAQWLDGYCDQKFRTMCDNPRHVWNLARVLFAGGRRSLEQERRCLQKHRLQDEFRYAAKFGLVWPGKQKMAASCMRVSPTPNLASDGPSANEPIASECPSSFF